MLQIYFASLRSKAERGNHELQDLQVFIPTKQYTRWLH